MEEEKKHDFMDAIIARIESGEGLFDDDRIYDPEDALLSLGENLAKRAYLEVWIACEGARAGRHSLDWRYEKRNGVAGLLVGDCFASMKRYYEVEIMGIILSRIESGEGLFDGDCVLKRKPDGEHDTTGTAQELVRLGGHDRVKRAHLNVWAHCELARAGMYPDSQYEKRDGVAGMRVKGKFHSMKNICSAILLLGGSPAHFLR